MIQAAKDGQGFYVSTPKKKPLKTWDNQLYAYNTHSIMQHLELCIVQKSVCEIYFPLWY